MPPWSLVIQSVVLRLGQQHMGDCEKYRIWALRRTESESAFYQDSQVFWCTSLRGPDLEATGPGKEAQASICPRHGSHDGGFVRFLHCGVKLCLRASNTTHTIPAECSPMD